MADDNIEDIFKDNGEAVGKAILEDYRRNGISEPLVMLSKEDRSLVLDSKTRDDYKLHLESNETEILKAVRDKGCLSTNDEELIDRCRKSEYYMNLFYALRGDYIRRGYYDADRLKKVFLKTYTAAFENLREKKGLNKDEEEDTGINIALIGYVAMRDFIGSCANSDLMLKNFSWYEVASLKFSPKTTSWTDWVYFWGRSVWDVASWTAIIGAAISGLFIAANPVVSGAVILCGAISKYVFDYVLRSKSEIRDGYKRNTRFAADLDQLKKVYDKVVKDKPFKIETLKSVELVKKNYDKKRFCKSFAENFQIGAIFLGIVSVISLSLLIPGLAPVFLAKVISSTALISVGVVSGALSIGSIIGMLSCKNRYKSLKEEKASVIKIQLEKAQTEKNLENRISIKESIKKNLEKLKDDKDKKARRNDPCIGEAEK